MGKSSNHSVPTLLNLSNDNSSALKTTSANYMIGSRRPPNGLSFNIFDPGLLLRTSSLEVVQGSIAETFIKGFRAFLQISRNYGGEKTSWTTLDDWNRVNDGINQLLTGAGFLPSTVWIPALLRLLVLALPLRNTGDGRTSFAGGWDAQSIGSAVQVFVCFAPVWAGKKGWTVCRLPQQRLQWIVCSWMMLHAQTQMVPIIQHEASIEMVCKHVVSFRPRCTMFLRVFGTSSIGWFWNILNQVLKFCRLSLCPLSIIDGPCSWMLYDQHCRDANQLCWLRMIQFSMWVTKLSEY